MIYKALYKMKVTSRSLDTDTKDAAKAMKAALA